MTSQPGKQTIAIYTRKAALKKSSTKCNGKNILRPFSKKIKIEHIS